MDYRINDSGYTGYLAMPPAERGPGLLVVQEIFGINPHIRDVVDLWAAAGFVVLAPDLYWRHEAGVQLEFTPEGRQKGLDLQAKCSADQIVSDLGEAGKALRNLPQTTDKLGVVGYSMGGTYAYLLAVRNMVDVGVGYYGVAIHKFLHEADNLRCPVVLHFGARDAYIPPPTVDEIRRACPRKNTDIHVYDAEHGFNCDQRGAYDRVSAMLAFGRTMVALNRSLVE